MNESRLKAGSWENLKTKHDPGFKIIKKQDGIAEPDNQETNTRSSRKDMEYLRYKRQQESERNRNQPNQVRKNFFS